jgi:hypothetical protein
MIFPFIFTSGALFILIGFLKRRKVYGKILLGLGLLLVGGTTLGSGIILWSCNEYSNYIKNELEKLNLENPCASDEDCGLITYYLCNPYCIDKDINLSSFYAGLRGRPAFCPLASCASPSIKWRCSCEDSICKVMEK